MPADGDDAQDGGTLSGDEDRRREKKPGGVPIPPQTPLFRATNLPRYRRQELIKAIQDSNQRRLVCYVADSSAALTRDDVVPFMDLLHNVPIGSNVDLLLHTSGGDIDAAEKIVGILRRRVSGGGEFRVIVPDLAKSAGTLVALGSDAIVMSDSSELGPIDPQIFTRSPDGQMAQRPAHTYVDGYDALVSTINDPKSYVNGKLTVAERQLLDKYDPALLNLCRQALRRSRQLAESLLKEGMLRDGSWTSVADQLTDNKRWLSQHGALIDVDDASAIGLKVRYLRPDTSEWQAYWRLYCEQRFALGSESPKLFESDYASLPFS
jgi:hypothetical protein